MALVVSARVTADAAGFRAGMGEAKAAAADMTRALDTLSTAAQQSGRSLQQAQGAIARQRAGAAPAGAALSPAAPPPGGLADWQRRNLRSQYFDIATSLYGGMSPLSVAAQQGPQIIEAYGGVGQAVRGVASAFTAARVAVGGVAGAVIGAAVAWRQYTVAQDDASRALNGMGRASGLTASGLRDVARQAAAQGRMSGADALTGAGTFAAAGVRGDLVAGLTASASAMSRGLGAPFEQVAAQVAEAMQDPAKGADALSARLGFLDGKTRELIRSLMAQGDQFGAQKVLADRLASSVAQLTTDTNALDRAWRGVKNTASDAWTGLGSVVDRLVSGPSLDQQLQMAERRLAEARAQTNGNIWWKPEDHAAALRGAEAEFARVKARVDAEKKKAADAQREIAANALSARATDAMRALSPDAATRQDLSDRIKLLRDAQASPDVAARVGGVGALADVLVKAQRALDTYIDTDERARQSDALAIRSIEARTAAQRAAIAAERERLSIAGDAGVGAAEAARREQAARDQVYAQARVDARDRLRGAREGAELVGLSDFDRRLRESDQRARQAALGARGDPRAEADARAAAATERATITREARFAPLKQAGQALAEQTAALERQAQAFGATTQAAAEFAAKQQLVNEYIRAGVPITDQMRGEIERYAAAQGRVAQASEDLQRAQARVVGGLDDIRATARGAFSGVIADLREGRNVADGLLASATRILDKIIETRVAGPLVEGLLGKDGAPGGGLFGDGVAKALGGAAVGTANITAASVIVNASGVAGGLVGAAGVGATPGVGGTAATGGARSAAAAAIEAAAPGGGSFAETARFRAAGVDARLTDILRTAAERGGFDARAISGLRPGDPRAHGLGQAVDIELIDKLSGKALPNYQDGSSFGAYERFAQEARRVQMQRYPELGDDFRWGGYFGGPKGKYGAVDTMHFDLAGKRVGMAGGSWQGGLTEAQRRLWPDAVSSGMGAQVSGAQVAGAPAALDRLGEAATRAAESANGLPTAFDAVSKGLSQGAGSLSSASAGIGQSAQQFASGTGQAFSGVVAGVQQQGQSFVGDFGSALQAVVGGLRQGGGGGGGFGGLISSFFSAAGTTGTLLYAEGGIHADGASRPLRRFGVSDRAAIFGEAGAEAAVPLPDGRSIPVTLRMSGAPAPADNAVTALPMAALAGAIGRLEQRLAAAAPAPAAPAPAGPDVVIENRAGAQITRQDEERPGGGRRQRVVVDAMVADAVGRPSSRARAAMAAAGQVGRR